MQLGMTRRRKKAVDGRLNLKRRKRRLKKRRKGKSLSRIRSSLLEQDTFFMRRGVLLMKFARKSRGNAEAINLQRRSLEGMQKNLVNAHQMSKEVSLDTSVKVRWIRTLKK